MKTGIKKAAAQSKVIVAAATAILVLATAPANAGLIVAEDFGGSGAALNGTSPDTFDAGIVAKGGSGNWVANAAFLDNGFVTLAIRVGAYLNLGSYIDDAKGTATGKFDLTMLIAPTTGTWLSLGFATNNTPNTTKDFTNTGSGTALTDGIGTIIYRATGAPGELDMFGGIRGANTVDGPDGNTGNRTLTVTLDLTPAGGYNPGGGNHGTVTWSDSVLGTLGNYTYTADRNFGSILITESTSSSGMIDNLSLTQIPEPAGVLLLGFGGLGLFFHRRRRRS